MHLGRALWGSEPIGMRRLEALVNGLDPRRSALVRSYDPERLGRGWDNQTELLAVIAEQVHAANRMTLQINSPKGSRMPDPLRIPRPDDQPVDRTAALKSLLSQKGITVVTPKSKRGDQPQE